jgi:hypothetical protein
MVISIKHTILFLVVISSVFICLPQARGGCAGGCAVSGGGVSSSSFMGDPAVNIDMSSFDEFVRDNLGSNPQTTLHAKSLSQDKPLCTNSSFNETGNCSASQNNSIVSPIINRIENVTSDIKTVKLDASGMQEKRLSTLVFTAFNNKF